MYRYRNNGCDVVSFVIKGTDKWRPDIQDARSENIMDDDKLWMNCYSVRSKKNKNILGETVISNIFPLFIFGICGNAS